MDAINKSKSVARHIQGNGTPLWEWKNFFASRHIEPFSLSEIGLPGSRAVIVAPHPDDELLGYGGLLQYLSLHGADIILIAVTDGEASHSGSSFWTPQRLMRERPRETGNALRALGVDHIGIHRLLFPDGKVASFQSRLHNALMLLFRATDVVFTTWQFDGHPDHEATAAACRSAADAQNIPLVQTPVWGWHWANPHNALMPWPRARKLSLSGDMQLRKRTAIGCFHSQLERDPSTGQPPIISSSALDRQTQSFEIYFL